MSSLPPEMPKETASPCSKRNWVLSVLSDDEALGPGGEAPPGIRVHLARCPACRVDAERLGAVSGALRILSELEPGATLAARAERRVVAAMSDGARPTGRTALTDETVPAGIGGALWRRRWLAGGLATAAAVLLAVGWYGPAWVGVDDGSTGTSQHVADVTSGRVPRDVRTAYPPGGAADRDEDRAEGVAGGRIRTVVYSKDPGRSLSRGDSGFDVLPGEDWNAIPRAMYAARPRAFPERPRRLRTRRFDTVPPTVSTMPRPKRP